MHTLPPLDLWSWWRRRKDETSDADALVAAWKAAWREGATAAWTSVRPIANPHPAEPERTAWAAGYAWGQRNPDRRQQAAPRLAHPIRRVTDSRVSVMVTRAATVGATGLAVYALSTGVRRWMRGRKPEGHSQVRREPDVR
jgi:hypothetical protein